MSEKEVDIDTKVKAIEDWWGKWFEGNPDAHITIDLRFCLATIARLRTEKDNDAEQIKVLEGVIQDNMKNLGLLKMGVAELHKQKNALRTELEEKEREKKEWQEKANNLTDEISNTRLSIWSILRDEVFTLPISLDDAVRQVVAALAETKKQLAEKEAEGWTSASTPPRNGGWCLCVMDTEEHFGRRVDVVYFNPNPKVMAWGESVLSKWANQTVLYWKQIPDLPELP